MVIRGDGTIVWRSVGHRRGGRSETEAGRAPGSPALIVRDCDVLNCDNDKIQKALADASSRAGERFLPVRNDGMIVIIRIHAGGKDHEVSCSNLDWYAKKYPDVRMLTQLHELSRRLRRVQVVTSAGGPEAAAEALKLGNAEVKRKFPDAPALTIEDIFSAITRDGTRVIQFDRRAVDAAKDPRTHVWATIVRPAKGEIRVNVEAVLRFVERPER